MRRTQGQGEATALKERCFRRLFTENLSVFRNGSHGCSLYLHFDLTAGDGMNDGEIPGSPLVFVDAAEKLGFHAYRAWFVEIHTARSALLAGRSAMQDYRCRIESVDHRDFICGIPDLIRSAGEDPRWAIGSVVADPNGKNDMPLRQLAWLAAECPRLDYILNWNASAGLRWLGYYQKRGDPRANEQVRLRDGIGLLGKGFWLIRSPVTFWNWAMLFGSNYERRDYKSMGFHDIRSDHGRSVLHRLSHTEDERGGQVQEALF